MQLLILSDIHGNLSALDAVLADVAHRFEPEGAVLLGDVIDYGMRSNEVVGRLQELSVPLIASVWGNHEKAIIDEDFSRFSSQRGEECARHTATELATSTKTWLQSAMESSGLLTFTWGDQRVLVVHGSLDDPFWGTIAPGSFDAEAYADYDVVLSGHSHVPHVFMAFAPTDDPAMRNKRAIVFLNPGSVGQPRNHDPRASYLIWDTEHGFSLNSVEYDIAQEQALYDGTVDEFYRDRLALGV